MRYLTAFSLTVLGPLLLSAAAAAEGVATFRISQAVQLEAATPSLQVYLDVLDADEQPLTALDAGSLSATIGEVSAEVESLRPLTDDSEGVAYIFLVDISRSLSGTEFALILDALDMWIGSLGEQDRVAALSFGKDSRLLVDFTNDHESARRILQTLGPTDDLTMFHRALRDGLELARRRDPGLPGRRVLVVLTDGRDEGSGLTVGDVLTSLRTDPVPIYAIGLSRLSGEGERERYLRLLNRFATNSGGAYLEGSTATVDESYAAMLTAVRRVWSATVRCSECRADGANYRLQLQLDDGGRVLSDGRRVRLLPPVRRAPASNPPFDPAAGETVALEPVADPVAPAPSLAADTAPLTSPDGSSGPRSWRWLGWLLLPIALAAAALLARRRRALAVPIEQEDLSTPDEQPREEPPAPPPLQAPQTPPPPQPPQEPQVLPMASNRAYETAPGVLTSRPPKPPALRLVRLTVVRGSRAGRQYSMTLLERAVVGARSTCDCVLVDEPAVEPEQFELRQLDGRVYIRNLALNRPTLVDGLPIEERHPLRQEVLIGNSNFILRMVCDEPRRVPV